MIRPLTIAGIGVAVVLAAIGLNYLQWTEEVGTPPDKGNAGRSAASAPEAGSPVGRPPTFDVVRVNPRGDAVIAGRAEPGRTVIIKDGDKEIGRVTADVRGEWVFIPETPLAAGDHRLSLEMLGADQTPMASDAMVVLVVPERDKDIAGQAASGGQPLALRVPREGQGGTTVLQAPSGLGDGPLFVDAIDYDDSGRVSVNGRATPGSVVQVYLSNRFLGRVRAGDDGRWALTPESTVAPGLYTLRVDQVDAAGKVLARVSLPFSRASFISEMASGSFIVVQPGNSLWRIARQTYGSGLQYTLIFEANKDQIKDPDLIYPGQVFAMPVAN